MKFKLSCLLSGSTAARITSMLLKVLAKFLLVSACIKVISRKYYPGFLICFFFSFRKSLSRIAKLWCWWWSNPIPPWFWRLVLFYGIAILVWKLSFLFFAVTLLELRKRYLRRLLWVKSRNSKVWFFLLKRDVVWKVAVFFFRFELDIYSSCKYRMFVGLLWSNFPIF